MPAAAGGEPAAPAPAAGAEDDDGAIRDLVRPASDERAVAMRLLATYVKVVKREAGFKDKAPRVQVLEAFERLARAGETFSGCLPLQHPQEDSGGFLF